MKKRYSLILPAAYVSGVILIAFAAVWLYFGRYIMAAAELFAGAAVIIYAAFRSYGTKKAMEAYISRVTENASDISESMLESVPMPLVICSVDGSIRWYNERFASIINTDGLIGTMPSEHIKELKWSEVLKFPKGKLAQTTLGESTFAFTWRMIKEKEQPGSTGEHYCVFLYFKDITTEINLKKAYDNERIDVAVIKIDNYDEFLQREDDDGAEMAASKIRGAIAVWAKRSNAVLKKTDRDRYFAAFEHQYLAEYINEKFDIIKMVSDIAKEFNFPLSISIGIGSGGTLFENEISARNALDLALGRGGGQVCIKDNMKFNFYGGKSGEYERSSRVKARAVATALAELILNSDNVIFMGHRVADFDCFGAAIGLQRAVRVLGKKPFIIHDDISPAVDSMYHALDDVEEYNGMFVNEAEAPELVTKDTLLVVLDTHRPTMLPCPELLDKTDRVVVIDHHRRSTEFISPCSLVYHEPYASSTCEMITELLEYMNAGDELTKSEARCIYCGIMLDTKNFMLKTGVRTFEAASYLRRLGLDTVEVKQMFATTRDEYVMKADIVKSAEFVTDNIAIAKTYAEHKNMRQIASQAADDMLNIKNIAASVVVYPTDGGTGFCARSVGTVNVQLIMEKLGGGGHMTVSGAFIRGIGVDEGVKRAEKAIHSYIEDTKTER